MHTHIFVPVNLVKEHWFTLVLDMREQVITCYDSLQVRTYALHDKPVNKQLSVYGLSVQNQDRTIWMQQLARWATEQAALTLGRRKDGHFVPPVSNPFDVEFKFR